MSRTIRSNWWGFFIVRVLIAGFVIFPLAVLLPKFGLSVLFFLLLPVIVTITTAYFYHYNRKQLIFRACLAFIYFSGITGFEILTHNGPTFPEYVVVTTTLALAVMFEPLRVFVQTFLEQRFHLGDDTAIRAVEAFTSSLREEIDLNKVREGLLTVAQQTMQPQVVTVWIRTPAQTELGKHGSQAQHEKYKQKIPESLPSDLYSPATIEIHIFENDPMMAYVLSNPGVVEVDKMYLDSPLLRMLKANEVEIVVPFVSQGETIGLLSLGPRLVRQQQTFSLLLLSLRPSRQKYSREDRSLLNTLAAQTAPALRVAQMVQEQQAQVRERERIEQELRTAQEIQHTFLPKDVPEFPGWQLTPYYQPAREVGGDFYDFLPFENGRLGLVIGDVTDKGIPAALVMTATRTMLRTVAQEKTSPSEVLARVNDLLYEEIPPKMFVTCFYAILDPGSGHISYANAGHDLPYRRQQEGISELRATGMPLGLMPGSCYDEHEIILAPGENLLFYTDGLVEAHNPNHEMFSFPRLKILLTAHADGTSLIDMLLRELQSFTGEGWEQEDDVTLMTLQRVAPSEQCSGDTSRYPLPAGKLAE
ncbi:MAG TPA: GAF domain-containing SpoIIE family protein phosphatase [Ktedonobacteraceae bacterium]|nr:GAF domain-containing SpoIIE family protein phosphatase [Ktedonobacteraceae bacterium]